MIFVLKNEKGFAVPLMMAISLIIVVISFAVSDTIRNKIKLATEINDKNKAYLYSYSGFNEAAYNILSSSPYPYSIKIYDGITAVDNWNLYGKKIRLNKYAEVTLQDQSGLIPFFVGKGYIRNLVDYYSTDSYKSNIVKDSLTDWYDKDNFVSLNGAESYYYRSSNKKYIPRNSYLQLKEELLLIRGFDKELYKKIEHDIDYHASGRYNFLTMSEITLIALLGDKNLVDVITGYRDTGKLNSYLFRELTGIQDVEDFVYRPSNKIRVEVVSKYGDSVDKIVAVIRKTQTATAPFSIIEWRR